MNEVVRRTINNYHRALGLRSTPMDDSDAQIVKPQFFRWSNGTFHRLPENFILTSIGTSESSNVAKTSLAGYLCRNMPDYKNGICPIRMCEASDFAIKNQRKRFSDCSRRYIKDGTTCYCGKVSNHLLGRFAETQRWRTGQLGTERHSRFIVPSLSFCTHPKRNVHACEEMLVAL